MTTPHERLSGLIAAAWGGVAFNVPELTADGEQCRLATRGGLSVTFDLHSDDLARSDAEIVKMIIGPAVVELKAKSGRLAKGR